MFGKTVLKVILDAACIPTGSTVTKPGGSTEFVLLREVKFFPNTGNTADEHDPIKARDGCVFMTRNNGNFSVYPPNKKLAWVVTAETFYLYLQNKFNENSK